MAAFLALLAACATPPSPAGPAAAESARWVSVVTHDLHSGIAIARRDLPPELWPERRDFPTHDYLEVGWGDRAFYQGREQGPWGALRAVLWPTPSVLHVVGVSGALERNFPHSEIVALPLPPGGLERLVQYIHDAYERGGAPAASPISPGLYGDSRFYPARESFHLFRTCNVWTARALREAGLPVRDAITQGGLLRQLRPLGKPVRADGQ